MASSGGNGNGGRNNLPALTDETIKELLSVQKQELAIRIEEVRRDTAEIAHNQNIAKQSIEAQERDRKHEREEITKRQKSQQWFVLGSLIVLIAFAMYALKEGQAELIIDILKVLVGFAGGMGYQAYRTYSQKEEDE